MILQSASLNTGNLKRWVITFYLNKFIRIQKKWCSTWVTIMIFYCHFLLWLCVHHNNPPLYFRRQGINITLQQSFLVRKKRKKEAVPDLNLPLQMEGVSTSRHAIGKSCSSIGGQVWSPMWWWGQWRTRESARGRKEPALRGRQLARSLSVSLPASVEKVCVSMCERSLNVRRREHSGACINPR